MYNKIDQAVKKPAFCAKVLKGATVLSGLLISVFGIVGLFYMVSNNMLSSTFFLVFSPLFVILFGAVIIAVELKAKMVLESFQFLQTLLGKGLFYIYVSSSVFYFFSCSGYDNPGMAWGCSMTIFGLGVCFCVLHFAQNEYSNSVKTELGPGDAF